MARSLNQVTLMGNLTRDPELRQTPSGQSVCSFSLALNRSYKDQAGEWQEATDYIDIVADRKSTRLNSSHPSISYAVFCLKKKNKKQTYLKKIVTIKIT